jgi:hypothetical protein
MGSPASARGLPSLFCPVCRWRTFQNHTGRR